MNKQQIEQFVMRYLEASRCQIIEKSPAHVTVKLSPEADRALTNRTYYWSFVERTGAEPETMTFTFVFDPETPVPRFSGNLGGGRIIQEHLTYGHPRLQQMFHTVKKGGRFVQLFEEPQPVPIQLHSTQPYSTWLVVNYKVELICDMKRDELHSLGISLSNGLIIENFHTYLLKKRFTPQQPSYTHTQATISIPVAKDKLEKYIERIISSYDHAWADEAMERMEDEIERIEDYFAEKLRTSDEEEKQQLQEQKQQRIEEIKWQFQPRIQVSVINCGCFHLLTDPFRQIDGSS